MTGRAGRHDRPNTVELVGLAVGAVAVFPATWWVLGRVDRSGDWIVDPDYAVQPPQIDRDIAHLIGAGSSLIAAAAVVLIFANVVRGRWRGSVAGVVLPLMAGFAYAGVAGHVVTAPVIGANIGAGLMLLAALPVGVLLTVVMAVSLRACAKPADHAGSSVVASEQHQGRPHGSR